MKELQPHKKDQVQIVNQKEIEKRLQLIGRLQPHPGQYVWECMLPSLEIKKVEFKEVDFSLEQDAVRKKLIVNPESLYCVAINMANAKRKFKSMILKLANT